MHALLLTMILAADPDPTPTFEAKLVKKDDTFSAKMEKGAVVWIARRSDVAHARTQLRAAISPDLL